MAPRRTRVSGVPPATGKVGKRASARPTRTVNLQEGLPLTGNTYTSRESGWMVLMDPENASKSSFNVEMPPSAWGDVESGDFSEEGAATIEEQVTALRSAVLRLKRRQGHEVPGDACCDQCRWRSEAERSLAIGEELRMLILDRDDKIAQLQSRLDTAAGGKSPRSDVTRISARSSLEDLPLPGTSVLVAPSSECAPREQDVEEIARLRHALQEAGDRAAMDRAAITRELQDAVARADTAEAQVRSLTVSAREANAQAALLESQLAAARQSADEPARVQQAAAAVAQRAFEAERARLREAIKGEQAARAALEEQLERANTLLQTQELVGEEARSAAERDGALKAAEELRRLQTALADEHRAASDKSSRALKAAEARAVEADAARVVAEEQLAEAQRRHAAEEHRREALASAKREEESARCAELQREKREALTQAVEAEQRRAAVEAELRELRSAGDGHSSSTGGPAAAPTELAELRWQVEAETRRRSAEGAAAEAREEALKGSLARAERAARDAECAAGEAAQRADAQQQRANALEAELRAARAEQRKNEEDLRLALTAAEERAAAAEEQAVSAAGATEREAEQRQRAEAALSAAEARGEREAEARSEAERQLQHAAAWQARAEEEEERREAVEREVGALRAKLAGAGPGAGAGEGGRGAELEQARAENEEARERARVAGESRAAAEAEARRARADAEELRKQLDAEVRRRAAEEAAAGARASAMQEKLQRATRASQAAEEVGREAQALAEKEGLRRAALEAAMADAEAGQRQEIESREAAERALAALRAQADADARGRGKAEREAAELREWRTTAVRTMAALREAKEEVQVVEARSAAADAAPAEAGAEAEGGSAADDARAAVHCRVVAALGRGASAGELMRLLSDAMAAGALRREALEELLSEDHVFGVSPPRKAVRGRNDGVQGAGGGGETMDAEGALLAAVARVVGLDREVGALQERVEALHAELDARDVEERRLSSLLTEVNAFVETQHGREGHVSERESDLSALSGCLPRSVEKLPQQSPAVADANMEGARALKRSPMEEPSKAPSPAAQKRGDVSGGSCRGQGATDTESSAVRRGGRGRQLRSDFLSRSFSSSSSSDGSNGNDENRPPPRATRVQVAQTSPLAQTRKVSAAPSTFVLSGHAPSPQAAPPRTAAFSSPLVSESTLYARMRGELSQLKRQFVAAERAADGAEARALKGKAGKPTSGL